ncbi:MAG: lipid A deacylase LpxR family protein [Chitinophagaceae bacterium]
MQSVRFLVMVGFVLVCGSTFAQVDDNTQSYHTLNSDRYFRLHYDNDFFTNSDYYYSQGISLELANPGLSRFLLSKVLLQPRNSSTKYGMSLNVFGYTPTDITNDDILYGDRPFASTLYIKNFAVATDTIAHSRLATSLTTGIIGPAAGGKQIQTGIHRWLNNVIPRGWQFQIANDLVLNYQLSYEKQIASFHNLLLVSTAGELQAGTLKDRAGLNISFMLGKFNNPYGAPLYHRQGKKHFDCYLFAAPQVNLIGYDATLQGGVFNRRSPYTIPASQIERITFQANAGIVVTIGKLNVEYCQSYLTREFNTGNYHRWAGLKFGLLF